MAKPKSFRDQYRKQKEDLQKRQQEAIQNKDTGIFGSFFDKTKVPTGRPYWKCGEGKHTIDVIPFVCGKNMPKMQNSEEGDIGWVVDLWIHRNVGVMNHPFPCPARNWGERCPICEELSLNRDKYTEEEYKEAKPKRRAIYLVWSHDTPAEEAKGIQIWDVAHWFMEDKLSEMATNTPKGGGVIAYYDVDNGKNVIFTRRGNGATNTQYLAHAFFDREVPEIPDWILDQVFPLDETIIHPTYKKLHSAFWQGKDGGIPEDSEEGDSTPTSYQKEEAATEEEAPFKETTEETETLAEGECPGGGTFGVDIEQLPQCGACPNWDECEKEADRLESEGAAEPEPEPAPEPPKQRQRLRSPKAEEKPIEEPPKAGGLRRRTR